jgi:hypothetical protein
VSCGGDGDCAAGFYCLGSTCVPQKGLGQSCGGNSQCSSGACAPEGICCSSACNGQCQYCDNTGICQYTTGNPHAPRAACNGQGSSPCGGSCNGSSTTCTYPTSQCAAATCTAACGQLNCRCFGLYILRPDSYCSNGSCPIPPDKCCSNSACTMDCQ